MRLKRYAVTVMDNWTPEMTAREWYEFYGDALVPLLEAWARALGEK